MRSKAHPEGLQLHGICEQDAATTCSSDHAIAAPSFGIQAGTKFARRHVFPWHLLLFLEEEGVAAYKCTLSAGNKRHH
eukprot:scaffold274413_cov18-Tisochrysis_lutea.AAC.1